jgi:TonB-dependent SusC/RagA subfamily outer membrane receptor
MKRKLFFFLLLTLMSITGSFGQKHNKKITITGYVVDDNKKPVVNAIIMVDDNNTDSFTDFNGFYKIKVKSDAERIGVISFQNGILEDSIHGRERINFSYLTSSPQQEYDPANGPGEEEMNLGYGTVKKKNVTSEVSKIDGRNNKNAFYSTIYDMIRGKVAGVVVTGTSIRIRGDNSLTLTNEPLFIVDGIQVRSIDYIKPSMVESIDVLKGASASIYGSRGANGVIIINLIRGSDKKK